MEILNLTKASRLPFKRAGSSLINTAENQFILIGYIFNFTIKIFFIYIKVELIGQKNLEIFGN